MSEDAARAVEETEEDELETEVGETDELRGEAVVHELARLIDDRQGEDLVALEVRGLVSYTDYLLICTARNERLAKSIHDHIYEQFKHGRKTLPSTVEGATQASWILMEYPDCVVHVFVPETRDRYRLDQLWGEAPRVELETDSAES